MTDERTQPALTLTAAELVSLDAEQEAEAVALVQLLLPYADRIIERRERAGQKARPDAS